MGSKTFEGVWFAAFSHDHLPPHVHGQYAGVVVIVELHRGGGVSESFRRDAIKPANAKRSDVRRILAVAATYRDELWALWEATHGTASE